MVSLATRGRHFGVTWIISSQVLNLVWRLRNHKEVETLCEELSGVYDAKTIMAIYDHATPEPFSFLFVRLDAKTRRDMFWLRFESRLCIKESDDGLDDSEREDEQVREDGHKPGETTQRPKRAPGQRK